MMSRLRVFASKLRGSIASRTEDGGIDGEIGAHLRLLTERYVLQGMSQDEAARAARRQFGNLTVLQQDRREAGRFVSIDWLCQDVRYAVRQLRRSPLFAAAAVLSVALGIGANTAVFTLLDHVLLNQLPVQSPAELVQLKGVGAHYGSTSGNSAFSYPMYEDLRDRNEVFSGMLGRFQIRVSFGSAGASERVTAELVTGTYFPVLGLRPMLGRLLTAEDDRAHAPAPVVVLGYDYWRTSLVADASVVGKEVLVNGRKFTVAGVAQAGFMGTERLYPTQLYVPIAWAKEFDGRRLEDRRRRWLQVFARRKPGISNAQATASLQPIFRSILASEVQEKEFSHASPHARQQFLKMTLTLKPGGGGSNRAEEVLAPSIWMAMGLAGLVLLIACANVANLMISRSAARQKEIAIRLALGAGTGRLVRSLLIESALLSAMGSALGFALAPAAMRLLNGIRPQMDPPIRMITGPDLRVLFFTIAACAVSALIFGLVPARYVPSPAATLKAEGGGVIGGGMARWRKALVIAQVSLSVVLLTSAGLLTRSLANLKDVHPGFDVHNLVAFSVDPAVNGYNEAGAKSFYHRLTRNLEALPGVQSAAMCEVPLLAFDNSNTGITVEGYASGQGREEEPMSNRVSPRFFETLRIPIHAGREFTERDAAGTPRVAIVNRSFAQHYFGDRPAVGRRIGLGTDPGARTDIEIVGVVGDTKYESMREPMPRQVYFPYLQGQSTDPMTAFVRTDRDSSRVLPLLRAAVRKLDSNVPVYLMKTEERQVEDSVSVEKLAATLAGAFSVLATFLASVGLYGVVAFLVTRRTREIGIRVALGAVPGNVIRIVLREVLLLVGVGIAIGVTAALMVNRLLASQLYGVSTVDPATTVASIVGISAAATVAAFVPARRAARIDPVAALRGD